MASQNEVLQPSYCQPQCRHRSLAAFWHYLANLYILRTQAAAAGQCWACCCSCYGRSQLPAPGTRQTTFMLQKLVWNFTVSSRSWGEQWAGPSCSLTQDTPGSHRCHGHIKHWTVTQQHDWLTWLLIVLECTATSPFAFLEASLPAHTQHSVQCLYITTDYPGDGGDGGDGEAPRTPNINVRWGWR